MIVTCVERKYKVSGNGLNYLITTKKELDQEVTDNLLHEDMELKTFLTHYEVTGFQKEESLSQTDSIYDIINLESANTYVNFVPSTISDMEELPPVRIRENIILNNMPNEFALEDVVKFFKDNYKNYDTKRVKERFSAVLQKLKKDHKVEIINPDTNRRYRKYRILVSNKDSDRTIDDKIDDKIEDKKVSIENTGT